MYNFSAYKPYGKIKYPVVKKYYTTGTKTIKKKVKGKAVTTKKTIKGKTQYKYFVKSGSKTVFSNKKSNGYNVASANPKNNLTYVYASKSGTASVKDLAYGAYTVTESGSAPANVIQTSKKASIVPAKKTAYKTKTENRVMDGKYVKVNYHRYSKKTVTFNNTFAYLTVNGTGLYTKKPVKGAIVTLKDTQTGKTAAKWTENNSGKYCIEGVTPGKRYTLSATDGSTASKAYTFTMPYKTAYTVGYTITEKNSHNEVNTTSEYFELPSIKKEYNTGEKINVSPKIKKSGLKYIVKIVNADINKEVYRSTASSNAYFIPTEAGNYKLTVCGDMGNYYHHELNVTFRVVTPPKEDPATPEYKVGKPIDLTPKNAGLGSVFEITVTNMSNNQTVLNETIRDGEKCIFTPYSKGNYMITFKPIMAPAGYHIDREEHGYIHVE